MGNDYSKVPFEVRKQESEKIKSNIQIDCQL